MKRIYLVLLFLVVIALASPASACERCRPFQGTMTCWSGISPGQQWCYGGFGEPCVSGGTCVDPVSAPPLAPSEQVCPSGPLGCSTSCFVCDAEGSPSGFVLETPSKTAPKSPQIKNDA